MSQLQETDSIIGGSSSSWYSGSLFLTIMGTLFLAYLIKSIHQIILNYNKLKKIPGLVQFFSNAPIKIPFLSPYVQIASHNSSTAEVANQVLMRENTNVMRIVTNGVPIIYTNDPKLFKEIFITKANSFPKTELAAAKVFGENLATVVDTEMWKRHFKVCSPAFSPTNLRYMCKVAGESIEHLFNRWDERMESEGKCQITKQDMSDITFQVLGLAGFNLDFGIFSNNEEAKRFKDALQDAFSMKAMVIRGLIKEGFLRTIVEQVTGLSKSLDYCSQVLDKIIEERRAKLKGDDMSDDEKSDILSRLVEANLSEKLISDSELKGK